MKFNIKQIDERTEKVRLLKRMLLRDNPNRNTNDIMCECLNLATILSLSEVRNLYDTFYKEEIEACVKSNVDVVNEVALVCC